MLHVALNLAGSALGVLPRCRLDVGRRRCRMTLIRRDFLSQRRHLIGDCAADAFVAIHDWYLLAEGVVMNSWKLVVAAVTALAVGVGTATAEDSFHWQGFYDGVFVGQFGDGGPTVAGGWIGYNFMLSERVLAGVEGDGMFYLNGKGGQYEVFVKSRLGVLLGDPGVLLYKAVGIGVYSGGEMLFSLGGGAEIPVSNNVTLRGEVEFHSGSINVFDGTPVGKFGAILHF